MPSSPLRLRRSLRCIRILSMKQPVHAACETTLYEIMRSTRSAGSHGGMSRNGTMTYRVIKVVTATTFCYILSSDAFFAVNGSTISQETVKARDFAPVKLVLSLGIPGQGPLSSKITLYREEESSLQSLKQTLSCCLKHKSESHNSTHEEPSHSSWTTLWHSNS